LIVIASNNDALAGRAVSPALAPAPALPTYLPAHPINAESAMR